MKFQDINFIDCGDGVQALVFFDNGYGASIIKTKGSYGGKAGLYEIAVISGDTQDWDINYDTEVTSDVLGYLNESEVEDTLAKIKAL